MLRTDTTITKEKWVYSDSEDIYVASFDKTDSIYRNNY